MTRKLARLGVAVAAAAVLVPLSSSPSSASHECTARLRRSHDRFHERQARDHSRAHRRGSFLDLPALDFHRDYHDQLNAEHRQFHRDLPFRC